MIFPIDAGATCRYVLAGFEKLWAYTGDSKYWDYVQKFVDTKSYRGWRHMMGQPVRGQETRSPET
jgi:hypothetical protein